jgi:hypothetical protein
MLTGVYNDGPTRGYIALNTESVPYLHSGSESSYL